MSGVFLMTMTAQVARPLSEQGVSDPYGHQETSERVIAEDMPCLVLPVQSMDIYDETKTVFVKRFRLFAPLDADLQFEDIVTRIRNRRGQDVFSEHIRMRVLRVQKYAASHQFASLEEVV